MGSKSIDRLCRSVLPEGYAEVQRLAPKLQQFLDQNLPEPVQGSVTLLTLNPEQIVIAASTPTVASYLRLHAREIEQQLRETFNLRQSVRFRTVPDSLLRPAGQATARAPRKVSPRSVEAIERNAEWIEDQDLKAALLALAASLREN